MPTCTRRAKSTRRLCRREAPEWPRYDDLPRGTNGTRWSGAVGCLRRSFPTLAVRFSRSPDQWRIRVAASPRRVDDAHQYRRGHMPLLYPASGSPAPREVLDPLSGHDRARDEESRRKGPSVGIGGDDALTEVQPLSCHRKPRLEDALLGAEDQPVPGGVRASLREPQGGVTLLGKQYGFFDSVRERIMRLGVHADRDDHRAARHSCGAVTVAVCHAPDDPVGPHRGPVLSRQTRRRRHAESRHCRACAHSHCGELTPTLLHSPGNQINLFRVQGRGDVRGIGEQLRDLYATGQQPCQKC
ncbi:hypothetical protein SDIAM103S_05511 [Streptomyces diastaticus subsp. diastaticus]